MADRRANAGLVCWLLVFSQLSLVTGCRSDSYKVSGGNAGQVSAAATSGPNLGEILYNMLHQTLAKKGTADQLSAFEKDRQDFVDAVNRVLPTDVSSNLWPTLKKLFPLVDDGTVQSGLSDLEGVLKDLLANQDAVSALAGLMGARPSSTLDPRDAIRLVSRVLAYPQLDQLATATQDLVNNQPDILRNVLALAARKLEAMSPATFQGNGVDLNGLASALLEPVDTTGLGDLGSPAWAVRLDRNNNPKVNVDPKTGKVVAPFVDDGTGCAKVDARGRPVDAQGNVITLRPFGSDGSRDSDGRALAANGAPVFDYFDAKQTLLGVTLVLAGKLAVLDVPGDLVTVLNKTVPRVPHADPNDPWSGFGPKDPFVDLGYAQLELVRRTPVPQLLEGLAALVKSDPVSFEQMVTSLISGINLARKSGFSTAGQGSMVDDLLPLVSDACKPVGNNVSAVRALLEAFDSAQAQLHNLPLGFARMMYYNDYGKRIPTGPGLPSSMQRLLGMMARANQVNAPFLGNLADLYIDTMAGNNKPILGIKLDVHTMTMLLSIGFIRDLLGQGKLVADDVNVLQDFANSGTLDAFIPIAKAFSDRGETHLLVEIMLKINDHYAQAMVPNEPAVIRLLESGAVEKLFLAIDAMTLVVVPSNGEKLIDVLADTIGALVDDSTPIVDRQGRSQKTLVNLLEAPLDDLAAAAQKAGVQDALSRALSNVMNLVLATYKDSAGNDRLVYGAFVSTLGDTLAALSTVIPKDPTARSAWCDQEEPSISGMLQSRDLAALVDIFLAIEQSDDAHVFVQALSSLFTPVQDSDQDAFGAVVQLVADVLQAPPAGPTPGTDAKNMATVMNWIGAEIDPRAGKLANLMTMMQRMMRIDDGNLLLKMARNLTDMGASGNDDSPLTVLMKVAQDVRTAGSPSGSATSPQNVTALLQNVVSFMDDQTAGLPYMLSMIQQRQKF